MAMCISQENIPDVGDVVERVEKSDDGRVIWLKMASGKTVISHLSNFKQEQKPTESVPKQGPEPTNEFEQFEKKEGSIEFLKAVTSVLNKVLVKSGLTTEKELIDFLREEIASRP